MSHPLGTPLILVVVTVQLGVAHLALTKSNLKLILNILLLSAQGIEMAQT